MDISANININNHRMNIRKVNPFACPQAGRIGNNVRESARPIQPRTSSPRITKFACRAPRENHSRLISVTAPPRDFAFPPVGTRGKFDPGLFSACELHCRRSINCSDFCLPAASWEPYFRRGAPPGRARTNLIWNYVLICGVSAVRGPDNRTFRSFIRLPSINFGEHKRKATMCSMQLLSLEANFIY